MVRSTRRRRAVLALLASVTALVLSSAPAGALGGSTLLWQFGPPSPYKREAVVASSVIFDSTIYFGWAYDLPYLYALY